MRTLACLIFGVIVASWAVGGSDAPATLPDITEPVKPYGIARPQGRVSAATSCAAASCHGGGAVGHKGSESTTWARDLSVPANGNQDYHARAYGVLFNYVSVRMIDLLKLSTPAHKTALCLKCHAVGDPTEKQLEENDPADQQLIAEGVGCAGCHGSSEKWLDTHYLPEWQALSNREKASQGFLPTKNLVARVSGCVSCHVGDKDRNVNHDLIAAGHPRLAFEYTRFHFQPTYRKHWKDPEDLAGFESRALVIGQVASLRAALEVLRSRAERVVLKDKDVPWPEFSEGSCYACHQNVVHDPFPETTKTPLRGTQGIPSRPPGVVPWQTWYSSLVPESLSIGQTIFGHSSSAPPDLIALRSEMEKRVPDPKEVCKLAGKAGAELDRILAEWQSREDAGSFTQLTPEDASYFGNKIAAGALGETGKLKDYDWDFITQRYLGLAAIYHANGGAGKLSLWQGPLERIHATVEITRYLTDPRRFDSPRDFRPVNATAPLTYIRDNSQSRRRP